MTGSFCYTFGEFRLDAAKKRLTRRDQPIELTDRQADVLLQLVEHAGEVVSKDALIDVAWQGVAVTDNSLEQAVSALRRALGDPSRHPAIIETVPRRGYRLRAEVSRTEPRTTDADLDTMLEPYRAWVEGRTALETLERDAVHRAEHAFARAVAQSPGYAAAHLGLANACLMRFESTRTDEVPEGDVLLRAGHHAREACRLDPRAGEAWATLAMVLHRTGMGGEAIAAARRAVMLESDNWRHHFRLAYVGWGEERLRASQRTLALFPDFALARWLAATVYVARRAFDLAEHELSAGAASQDAQEGAHGAFPSVGLHWLLGLVLLARRDEAGALRELQRELAFEPAGQVYGRECCANTWYAIGALRLRQGRKEDAGAAFDEALSRVPRHTTALVGLALARHSAPDKSQRQLERRIGQLEEAGLIVDAALGRAALHVAGREVEHAAQLLDEALGTASAGSAGWIIPVEPLLNVSAHGDAFHHVFTRLRARAA